MTYRAFKDLPRTIVADKALPDKIFNTAKNSKHDAYQTSLAPTVYKFFVKKTLGGAVKIQLCKTSN